MTDFTASAMADARRNDNLRAILLDELASMLAVDVKRIDCAKSFDDYGLDSLDAVIATGKLSERLDIDLPPEFLLMHRTVDLAVEGLAELIGGTAPGEGRHSDARTRPVFLFAGGGGIDLRLSRLTYECPPDLVFETPPPGNWREWIQDDLDLTKLAVRVCDRIEARCPSGGIRLAGYSSGGQLAWAVAFQLEKRGRLVENLILFDTVLLSDTNYFSLRRKVGSLLRRGRDSSAPPEYDFSSSAYDGPASSTPPLSGKLTMWGVFTAYRRFGRSRLGRLFLLGLERAAPAIFRGREGLRLENALQMQLFTDMWYGWLRRTGEQSVLACPVVLIRSEDPGPPDWGWSRLCGALRVTPARGGHHSMFDREHLGSLASRFVEVLGGA